MFRNKLYSGRRRYMTQYVENYPMLAVDRLAAQTIIRLVRQMRERPNASTARALEDAVAAGFGFAEETVRSPSDIRYVLKFHRKLQILSDISTGQVFLNSFVARYPIRLKILRFSTRIEYPCRIASVAFRWVSVYRLLPYRTQLILATATRSTVRDYCQQSSPSNATRANDERPIANRFFPPNPSHRRDVISPQLRRTETFIHRKNTIHHGI